MPCAPAGGASRRAGIVERIDADQWRIPDDLVSRAAAQDAGRDSQASVRVLSGRSEQTDRIGRQRPAGPAADPRRRGSRPCANRLGSKSASHGPAPRGHHIRKGRRHPQRDSRVFYRRNLLAIPAGAQGSRRRIGYGFGKGLPFRAATDGERQRQVYWNRASIEQQVRRGREIP